MTESSKSRRRRRHPVSEPSSTTHSDVTFGGANPRTDHSAKSAGSISRAFRVYARASHPEQDTSVEQQIDEAEPSLRTLGMLPDHVILPREEHMVLGIYADDGVSAWKFPPEERRGSKALLDDLRRNAQAAETPGVLWVYALSRLLRPRYGGAEAVALLHTLRGWGWIVYSEFDKRLLDVHSRGEGLLATITVAMQGAKDGEHSREKQASVKRAKKRQVEQGIWLGGFAPAGYERWAARVSDASDPATGRRHIIEWVEHLPAGRRKAQVGTVTLLRPCATTASHVRALFHLVADGEAGHALSLNELERRLNNGALHPPDTRGGWSRTALNALLVNETYIAKQRDQNDVLHDALWEPLIDVATWYRVQARLTENLARRRGINSAFPLSGLVACTVCSQRFFGTITRTQRGKVMRYYKVNSRWRVTDPESCQSCRSRVRAETLESAVLDVIASLSARPEVQRAVAVEVKARQRGHDSAATMRDETHHELSEIRRQIGNLVALARMGGEVDAAVAAQLRELNAHAQRVQGEHDRAQSGLGVTATTWVEQLHDFDAVWQAAGPAEQKTIIGAFIAHIAVDARARTGRILVRRPTGGRTSAE